MAEDLPGVVSQFCLLFTDDMKICGSTLQREEIQADLFAMDSLVGQNSLLMNVLKSECVHIGGLSPVPLLIPDDIEASIPLPPVSSTKDLRTMIDYILKPTI